MPTGSGGAAQACWVASSPSLNLLFRDFPDGTVCFDAATGETRLLAPLTRFLLDLLAGVSPGGLRRDSLIAEVLSVEASDIDTQTVSGVVDVALAELAQAGLIHPDPSA